MPQIVTRDASSAAGAPEGCDSSIRAAFRALFRCEVMLIPVDSNDPNIRSHKLICCISVCPRQPLGGPSCRSFFFCVTHWTLRLMYKQWRTGFRFGEMQTWAGWIDIALATQVLNSSEFRQPPVTLPTMSQGAFDAYAMGNYPYSSSYISG